MWRNVSSTDFYESNTGKLGSPDIWWVCSKYEIQEGLIFAAYPHHPDYWEMGSKNIQWRAYEPLTETPDLFLRFARLYEHGFSERTILSWSAEYGLLGSFYGWRGGGRQEAVATFLEDLTGNTLSISGGGPDSTAIGFWDEVCWAAGTLAAYEASLRNDADEAKSVLLKDFAFLDIAQAGVEREWWWKLLARHFGKVTAEELASLVSEKDLQGIKEFVSKDTDLASRIVLQLSGEYLWSREEPNFIHKCSGFARHIVEEKVKALCYPNFFSDNNEDEDEEVDVSKGLQAGMGARNLLGVMYLQIYWLMTSGGELSRCEYCGRTISLAQSSPATRKRRSDKRFCDAACRQAAYRVKQRAKS